MKIAGASQKAAMINHQFTFTILRMKPGAVFGWGFMNESRSAAAVPNRGTRGGSSGRGLKLT